MKSKLQFFKKVSLALVVIAMFSMTAVSGVTYTAVMSGNWNSTATWGGAIPSFSIVNDRVEIPNGITVSLDQSLTINDAPAILDIAGTLTSGSDDTLTLGLGNLVGTGNINVSSVSLLSGANLIFSGTLVTGTFDNAASCTLTGVELTVTKALNLTHGVINVMVTGSLTIGNNADINISGGVLVNSGGTLDLTANYNVTYFGIANQTGFELTGSGLNNVSVNVPAINTVVLASDLTVKGTLSLLSGTLVLDSNNVVINGDIAGGGIGAISSDGASDIYINSVSSPSSPFRFAPSGNMVGDFTVNMTNSGSAVTINSDLIVNGTLHLTKGNINIGNYSVQIGASGSISGGSSDSYVITTALGYVSMNIAMGNTNMVNFPIGTSVSYAPALIQLNGGSPGGTFRAGIATGLLAQGTSGTDLAIDQPVVNSTWFIGSTVASGLNMNLKLIWSSSTEVNGFDGTASYITYNNGGVWDMAIVTSANAEGGSFYSLERTGITSLGSFAVFGENATIVSENAIANAFELYPNPASTNINIKNTNAFGEAMNVDIYDATGRLVNTYLFRGSEMSVPVNMLKDGTYFLKLYDGQQSAMKRFVKAAGTN